jgi:hypothetical protein
MVTEFLAAIEQHDSARTQQLRGDLQALGVVALAAIQDAMPHSSKSQAQHLIRVLVGIGGKEVTQYLVQLAAQPMDSDVALPALAAIGESPISFPLTEEQTKALLVVVDKASGVISATNAAYVLSRCEQNDKAPFVQPILDRFIKEIADPTEVGAIEGSYVSPRVCVLSQFLRCFDKLADKGVLPLKSALKKATSDEMSRWLTLALGMCRERSVAETIKGWIKNNPDPYFRTVAVRAYARSAGQEAIPFLETLLDDKFESEYDRLPDGSPVYPIRLAARDELARLEDSSKNR